MGATGTKKFLSELVDIVIHDERVRARPARITVNAHTWVIKPNYSTRVPRRVVEVLCQATRPVMRRKKFPKRGGKYGFRQAPTGRVKLVYPFSILRDDNPKGGLAWLKAIIGQSNESQQSASSKSEGSRSARM